MAEVDPDVTLQPAAPAPESRAFAEGTQAAGRYRITRFVASGAMGEVFAAEDMIVGGTVALKALKPELAGSSEAVERLRREIALARKVTNAHVCRLHDVGEHAGRVFLTMELLDGVTLAEHVKASGPLPLDEVEDLVAQLVDGLAALHAAGIVHRDFKTANTILVGKRAVITDFGLARSVDAGHDASLTAEATLLGTPAYMAPEQVEGRAATPASDIYALGVVLFELLTARLPFREESAMATATARLHKDPPRVATLRADAGRWDAIVARCLEREEDARFARVEDVLVGVKPRRRVWIPFAIAGLAAAIAIPFAFRGGSAPAEDASCPAATKKLRGVWDPATRTKIAARYEGHKPFIVDMWRTHAKQLDAYITAWAPRWDAACASKDRRVDLLLYAQRLTCLDEKLRDMRPYIDALADPRIAIEDFARASPGEYPFGHASECDNPLLLRAQPAPPPPANTAQIEQALLEAQALRVEMRLPHSGGLELGDSTPLFTKMAKVEDRLIDLGYPRGGGDLRYWRALYLASEDRVDESDAANTSLIELAENTRDDYLLVRALTRRVYLRANKTSNYDVATGDAVLARCEGIAKRLGDPPALHFDIAEARWMHARRAGRAAEAWAVMKRQIQFAVDMHMPLTALDFRGQLAAHERDRAATEQVLVETEAYTGATNLILAGDFIRFSFVLDAAKALANLRRAISIIESSRGTRPFRTLPVAHELAARHALELGKRDDAIAHIRAAVVARIALGETELAAYADVAESCRNRGKLALADLVLELGQRVDGSELDRAKLARSDLAVRLDKGERPDPAWAKRLTPLPAHVQQKFQAVLDVRAGRVDSALAHADALEKPRDRAATRASIFAELGRHADVVSELWPFRDALDAKEQFNSPMRQAMLGLLGNALVETGRGTDAIPLLEQALLDNLRGWEARFALARAIPDRERAIKLATQARDELARMGRADKAAAVDAWLKAF